MRRVPCKVDGRARGTVVRRRPRGPVHVLAALLAVFVFALAIDFAAFPPEGRRGPTTASDEMTWGSVAGSESMSSPSAPPGSLASGQGSMGYEGNAAEAVPGASPDASALASDVLTMLPATEAVDGNSSVVTTAPAEVPDVAVALLAAYQSAGHCVLAQEGYLDLVGHSWGCVVQGDAWVDVGVVQAVDGGSRLSVVRMWVDRWAEEDIVEEWGELHAD